MSIGNQVLSLTGPQVRSVTPCRNAKGGKFPCLASRSMRMDAIRWDNAVKLHEQYDSREA